MENFGKTAVFPGGYGRIGVYRVKFEQFLNLRSAPKTSCTVCCISLTLSPYSTRNCVHGYPMQVHTPRKSWPSVLVLGLTLGLVLGLRRFLSTNLLG